ncbi:MAG: hypothetical protein KJP09_09250 [Bacteroidia bacterium]|nr:hypothetical protein [Bacteroidia bacterium]MBT8309975.1 hypothetical protein [Bacteroidia bacterium]NND10550.1 hypothetical protein [Flavobacteriaceae bacterium]NNK27635.1 hypothetical protein [Flavobacteriaceae bacterium]NNL61665.1 hypothetical protein [Flavobacteriaceae bacterium]
MKHSFLHRSLSVALALFVMMSTLSFAFEKHFCGNKLVDVALFTEAKGCGMEIPSNTENTCCKDEVDLVKGQDQLKLNFQDFDLELQQFVATFIYTYINLFEGLQEQVIPFKEYSPPNLHYDRQVLFETYLI